MNEGKLGSRSNYLDLLLIYDETMHAQKDTRVSNENLPAPIYGIRFACGRKVYFNEPWNLPKEIRFKQVLG